MVLQLSSSPTILLLQASIRAPFCAARRYIEDASDAVAMLMEDVVLHHVPAEALLDPNEFRGRVPVRWDRKNMPRSCEEGQQQSGLI